MSWSQFLETGRGLLGLRLSIEGLGYEFVSASRMEVTTSQGRERIACLSREGIGWRESADIIGGKLDVDGFTCRLVGRQYDAVLTKALAWQPSAKTWLNADVTTAATSITVLSTTGLAVDDVIHIGTEAILITTVTSSTVLAVTRAYWGTIAQAHYTSDGERLAKPVVTLTRPMSIEGRRCNLYAYGIGDDPELDGTIVFRGVCATDASLDTSGGEWSITIDSITRLMDSPMGGELEDPVGSRGIYYSWKSPLTVIINEGLSTTLDVSIQIPSAEYPTSFFETQDDFAEYLTDAIDTEAASFAAWQTANVKAVSGGADDWWLEVTLGGTITSTLLVYAFSAVDGMVNVWHLPGGVPTEGRAASTTYEIRGGGGAVTGAGLVPGGVQRAVPRGFYGDSGARSTGYISPAMREAHPFKIYLGGSIDVAGLTAVRVDGTNGESAYHSINSQSATERWIVLGAHLGGDPLGGFGYGRGGDIKLGFVRLIGVGDLSVVRDGFVADSPDLANIGGMPFLTSSDLASWTTVAADAARGRQWAAQRRYIIDEETTAADYLAEEMKAIGVFPIIDTDGKIGIARMRSPAATEPATTTIDTTTAATDQGFPTWERNAWGRINQISYSWGYDPAEEEHRGTVVVRDVQAFSESKAGNGIEAAPKSEPVYGEPSYGELVGLAWPYLGIFGRAYAVVRMDAELPAYFRAVLGDPVTVTLPNVPDQVTGERGITEVSGILVERGADFHGGRASLGVLVLGATIAGYAPSLQIDSFVDNGGGSYTLTVSEANPLAAALDMTEATDLISDHWHVGDGVAVSEAGTTTAPITGEITAVTATTITATLSAAPTSKDVIHYDTLAGSFTDDQAPYVYQASTAGRLGADQAKEYAP